MSSSTVAQRPTAINQRRMALSVRAQATNNRNADSAASAKQSTFKPTMAKIAAAAFAAAALTFSPNPAFAELDTDTYKAGASAKIESSDLRDQSPASIVDSLKQQVLPKAEEKLSEVADQSGGSYANSVLQELKTVRSEIDALEKQLQGADPPSKSAVKSTASGIEQQVNALKALLGFD
ncbi:hypothetical protein NADE_001887 [Nannochloris sp. 'desiccata']|nr:hypothetical protein KSW81_002852 [Chlorella desiccata (nom. nud.)]KAH7624664.1 hypothetical protein NADE_001887 [Chlorella desiccata (nom. nud.)]